MTAGNYGPIRATDADRDSVHTVLQAAYADGRLTWDEFESRSATLMAAKTYDQLGALTVDLRQPVPYRQGYQPGGPHTNTLAVLSLCFGVGQVFLWFVGAIAAIVCGHAARRQIRQTGEAGDGMALAGLILGYAGVLLPALVLVLIIAIAVGSS
jgi:hypothetical protein